QPRKEVFELDDISSAFGQFCSVDRNKLTDENFDVLLHIVTGTGSQCLQAIDVAMVVSTQQVDFLVEAAVLFGQIVSRIASEIGWLAVCFDQHTVFVITKVGGAEPEGAFLFKCVSLSFESLKRVFDRTVGMQL